MIKSFVLNIGRGIELLYREGPGDPDIVHPVNTDNDIVIRGFIDADYSAENDAVSNVGLYLNRSDILNFMNEIDNVREQPGTKLILDDPAQESKFSEYCKIRMSGGMS